MVVIAVIGGTGSVGRTIVDAFVQDGTHEVIVFARKVPEGTNAAPVYAVDYNNIDSLVKILEEKKVHTVISTLTMIYPEAAQAELNFITAADKASCTKRFVASNYGNAAPEEESFRQPFNASREQNAAALRKTNLEWTVFHNGWFLDYFGMPHVETYLTPFVFAIDIAHRQAALPGTNGEKPITFTYTKDLAKFVVAAMSLSKWDEALHCYSEQSSFANILALAEEMTGSKFNVTYDSVEKLHSGEVTELPSHKYVYDFVPKPMFQGLMSKFGLWAAHGMIFVPKEGSLNEKFPEISTKTAREVVGHWKGK